MQLISLITPVALLASLAAASPQNAPPMTQGPDPFGGLPFPTDLPSAVVALYSEEASAYSQLATDSVLATNTALLASFISKFQALNTNTALLLSLESQEASAANSALSALSTDVSAGLASVSSVVSSVAASVSSEVASAVASASASAAAGATTASSSSSHGAAPTAMAVQAGGLLAAAGMAGVFLL